MPLKNTPNLPLGDSIFAISPTPRKKTNPSQPPPAGLHHAIARSWPTIHADNDGLRAAKPSSTERESVHVQRKKERKKGRRRGERESERERARNTWYNHAALKPHIATMATERRIVVIVIVGGCAPE